MRVTGRDLNWGQLVQPNGIVAVVRVETLLCSSGSPGIYDCQVLHNKT